MRLCLGRGLGLLVLCLGRSGGRKSGDGLCLHNSIHNPGPVSVNRKAVRGGGVYQELAKTGTVRDRDKNPAKISDFHDFFIVKPPCIICIRMCYFLLFVRSSKSSE